MLCTSGSSPAPLRVTGLGCNENIVEGSMVARPAAVCRREAYGNGGLSWHCHDLNYCFSSVHGLHAYVEASEDAYLHRMLFIVCLWLKEA